jgi:peptidoglycan/LPS O-acetylase OafA/YrhL
VTLPLQQTLTALVPWRLGFATYALSDVPLAITIALGFAGLRTLSLGSGAWLARVSGPIRYFANMSFSLYLLHWPLLKLLRLLRAPEDGALGFIVVLAVILAASAAFASITEHHRHRVRALLERMIGAQREAPAAA